MVKISGIEKAPVFCPTVADFYSGMEVTVPLFKSDVSVGIEEIKKIYSEKYNSDIVFYLEDNENGFLASNKMSGKDSMQIAVYGNDERMILTARYDNLGKGASGAAVENITRYARSQGYTTTVTPDGEDYRLTLKK